MPKLLLVSAILLALGVQVVSQPPRTVAVTIDDLPVISKSKDLETQTRITRDLLRHIKEARVPSVGFVNEGKLFRDPSQVEAQKQLLRMWLSRGLELGNHTYSHHSLHRISLAEYKADILRGEIITKRLLREFGMEMRYFRHPFLNTGMSIEVKQGLDRFLAKHKYTIAPVSIDNSDWAFARAYDNAIEKKDLALKRRIGLAYVPYLEAKTDYWERQSKRLFDREIRQILLLHANSINADFFDDLARMYKGRGYRFVTLEKALEDKAYRLPDTFVGRAGISWLHRWALERGRETLVKNEPRVPAFVMKAAGLDSE